MYWVLHSFRHCLDVTSRSPRREYWLFMAFVLLGALMATMADFLIGYGPTDELTEHEFLSRYPGLRKHCQNDGTRVRSAQHAMASMCSSNWTPSWLANFAQRGKYEGSQMRQRGPQHSAKQKLPPCRIFRVCICHPSTPSTSTKNTARQCLDGLANSCHAASN